MCEKYVIKPTPIPENTTFNKLFQETKLNEGYTNSVKYTINMK